MDQSLRFDAVKRCRLETHLKLAEFIQLLPLLPVKEDAALSTLEITLKFYGLSRDARPSGAQTRAMQRYLGYLSDHVKNPWAPLKKIDKKIGESSPCYFLRNEKLLQWFMSDGMALNFLLTRDALRLVSGGTWEDMPVLEGQAARRLRQSSDSQRLWTRLRMARSGMGRLSPEIKPAVLSELLSAVKTDRQVRLVYQSNHLSRLGTHVVTIQGLVMKDDTLYVLATQGLADPPRHFAAHRITSVEVLHKPADARPGFDLDAYIDQQYHLSHLIDGGTLLDLQLRVHSTYLAHFRERPLTASQTISPDPERPGWSRVQAMVPNNYMLQSYLQSMGAGLEVLAPAQLRQEIAKQARAAAALYDDTP